MSHSLQFPQERDLSEATSLLMTADTGPLPCVRTSHQIEGTLLNDKRRLQRVPMRLSGLRNNLNLLDDGQIMKYDEYC